MYSTSYHDRALALVPVTRACSEERELRTTLAAVVDAAVLLDCDVGDARKTRHDLSEVVALLAMEGEPLGLFSIAPWRANCADWEDGVRSQYDTLDFLCYVAHHFYIS